ncbi:DsbA family protein [Flavobacteriales bacterium]|nr:DsbA family protein [Flavobacteriales bacterium]
MNLDWIDKEENSVIYFGDTMCSWCYGFAPEMDKFIKSHPELKVRLVQGGLRPFNTELIYGLQDFLLPHWKEIEERTGQVFKYDILKNQKFIYDTEPASRAVVVARMIDESKEWAFFKKVQTAFYKENKDTSKLSTYIEIAKELGLDTDKFTQLFDTDEAKYATKSDFQLSAEMGVKGFPSVVIKVGKEFFMISNGYREAKDLEEVYQRVLKEIASK